MSSASAPTCECVGQSGLDRCSVVLIERLTSKSAGEHRAFGPAGLGVREQSVATSETAERRARPRSQERLEGRESVLEIAVGLAATLEVGEQKPGCDVVRMAAHERLERRHDLDARFEPRHVIGRGTGKQRHIERERAVVRICLEPERKQVVGRLPRIASTNERSDRLEAVLARDPHGKQADPERVEVPCVGRVATQLGEGGPLECLQLVLVR